MKERKMTEKEILKRIGEIVGDLDTIEEDEKETILAFVTKKVNSLENKKKSRTKTQIENEEIMDFLYKELEKVGEPIMIKDFIKVDEVRDYVTKDGNSLSGQKVSALFSKMKKEGWIVRTESKKKEVYFSIKEKDE